MTYANYIRELIQERGALAAHEHLIEENNIRFLSPALDDVREVMAQRTLIYTVPIAEWAQAQQAALGYRRRFAVVALGATGRNEQTPCSDLDIAFLFDDALEGNSFVVELERQTIQSDDFEKAHGFRFTPLPHAYDYISISGKDLTSFLDMRAIYDPTGLAPEFRKRLHALCDPFEHFLHIRGFWKTLLADPSASERFERFDIKHDALRVFQSGVWTLAVHGFQHSQEIYSANIDELDLAAYFFLLRIRAWQHLQPRPAARYSVGLGKHREDIIGHKELLSFGEMLGPNATEQERMEHCEKICARLLSARRRVAAFARSVVEQKLRDGYHIKPGNPIALGNAGLRHTGFASARTPQAKSRCVAALLLAAQRYRVPIDPTELQSAFFNAGEWLVLVPDFGALFYDREGSLADTFEFIRQIDGMEERIFPGRTRFEASLDARVRTERKELRGTLELRKLRELERIIANPPPGEYQPIAADDPFSIDAAKSLDIDSLAAVKLALKTKRLPLTPADLITRNNTALLIYDRFASGFSGIPLAEYYQQLGSAAGFTPETLATTEFLVANRRAFKDLAETGYSEKNNVQKLLALCGDEQRLHALFLFTSADSAGWHNYTTANARWFVIRELYEKTLHAFRVTTPDVLELLIGYGFDKEQDRVLRDFGADFFGGLYRRHIKTFGAHLASLVYEPTADIAPKVAALNDGAGMILGVAARDFPGLAACISGALKGQGVVLAQAHFFSAMNHRLVLDFFHLAADGRPIPKELTKAIELAICEQRHLADADEAALPSLSEPLELDAPKEGAFRLRCTISREASSVIYTLCLKLHRHLRANIHSLVAQATATNTVITIHFATLKKHTLEEVRALVAKSF